MSNILLINKKTIKELKESSRFRIVWEYEQYKKRWRKMRLLRITNKKNELSR